jgi:uncharacterized protein YecE (DUF72 family)
LIKRPISLPMSGATTASLQSPGQALQKYSAATFVGTAGWSVPAEYTGEFSAAGTHLERYATRMNAVEINSSFYRPHRRATYARWACSVPSTFRFAVKIPKEITHEHRLIGIDTPLERFINEVSGLGAQLGVLLVQLPPSLAFEEAAVDGFFRALRSGLPARIGVACEPRHGSWFCDEADALLRLHEVARVAADPPRAAEDGKPGGWAGLNYYRLHGSPRIYYSSYKPAALEQLHREMLASRSQARTTWCIFDNTAAAAALGNALALAALDSACASGAGQ